MDGEHGLQEPTQPNRAWMITFTDLVSLMLTFFVMLFAMSSVKVDDWRETIDALSKTLNPESERTITAKTSEYNIRKTFQKRAINLDYLAAVLEEKIGDTPILTQGRLLHLDDRLVFALPGDLLFESGRAVLSDRARGALFELGGILRNIGNQVGVNGHTDPAKPTGGAYTSNWELSLGRAAAVANALRGAGYEEKIIAYGYAETRFGDLSDLPEDERSSIGRRVDIVILPTVGEG